MCRTNADRPFNDFNLVVIADGTNLPFHRLFASHRRGGPWQAVNINDLVGRPGVAAVWALVVLLAQRGTGALSRRMRDNRQSW